jgi:PIN domain nuclease of toxin-antitoxin system
MVNRYLLDTHTFLWAVSEHSQRLGNAAFAALEDAEAELYISSASIYEATYKDHKGKLSEFSEIIGNFEKILKELGAKELPVSWAHALIAGRMEWNHKDPFDRMLIAQAITENLTLISCDAAFADAPDARLLWES